MIGLCSLFVLAAIAASSSAAILPGTITINVYNGTFSRVATGESVSVHVSLSGVALAATKPAVPSPSGNFVFNEQFTFKGRDIADYVEFNAVGSNSESQLIGYGFQSIAQLVHFDGNNCKVQPMRMFPDSSLAVQICYTEDQ